MADTNVYTLLLHREMIEKMPMGMFIMEFFNVAAQLNPLKLTDEEIGLFSACLIMCPGTSACRLELT